MNAVSMVPGSITSGPNSRRRVRREDRRRLILAAAERSFFDNGYAGTSMSAIAAAIGGSKTTLWSYFASKAELFEALLDTKIEAFAAAIDMALLPDDGVAAALSRFGRIFLESTLRPDFCAMRRLITGEGARFPEVAVAMHDRGPRRVRDRLIRFVECEMANGVLRRDDAEIAARQFMGLCQSISFSDRIWHRPDAPEPDPASDVAHAVDTFLRAYAVSPPTPERAIVAA